MLDKRVLSAIGVAVLAGGLLLAAAQPAEDGAAQLRTVIDQYCVACHNDDLRTAGLSLETIDTADLEANGEIWERMFRKLRARQMPPSGMTHPSDETYAALVRYIDSGRDRLAREQPNPGRPTLHRLNRTEYQNAIRDMLALQIDATDLLPADDIGYGFDNIGDVLNVSPLLLERYLAAASRISRLAVGDPTQPVSFATYDLPRGLIQLDRMNEELPFGSRGGLSIRHHFPVDGEYVFTVKLATGRYDQILGLERDRQLDLRLDNERIQLFTIASTATAGRQVHGEGETADSHLEIRIPVKAGTRSVAATFLKDRVMPEGILLDDRETAFFEGVGSVSIAGPYNASGPGETESREKIFVCYPEQAREERPCAEEIISSLAHRAYRRPIVAEDMPQLMALYDEGVEMGGFESGVRLALQKILVSPEFIFRMEFDPPDAEPGSAYRISDLELASRLSFFLWSSIPDDELLMLAESGQLRDQAVLEDQVMRMLADPRSEALIENFSGQWLFLRNIERVQPDPVAFPNFDENLRFALKEEMRLLIDDMVRSDASILDLLDADYTYLNERLAQHYGIEGIYGPEFRRVTLSDERRFGILGKASILTVTSYPNRTAPTIRGKWVLEQMLGTPPPPPPPNVPTLVENENTRALTMRERMEMHRANPSCAVCHRIMDPLGFALENFDGLGRWRDTLAGSNAPIDSSGALPDGTMFSGPAGLREVLMSQDEPFMETFTGRLLTYALGRGVEEYDGPVIRQIVRGSKDDDYRWSSVILEIVRSVPFQMRRASDDRA